MDNKYDYKENSRVFVGDIRRCTGVRRTVYGELEGFGTIDKFGSIEIDSEIYKKDALLLEVTDDKYVDFSYFNCYEDLMRVIACVKLKEPLENVILSDFEIVEGMLFVDPTSLRSFDSVKRDFVNGDERFDSSTYNMRLVKDNKSVKTLKKKNKLR